MFHNNIVQISEKMNKRNLLKICFQVPTLQISAWFAFIFTMGKSKTIWCFKKQWLWYFLCIGSYDKRFFIKYDTSLHLLSKAPSKKKKKKKKKKQRLSERCPRLSSFGHLFIVSSEILVKNGNSFKATPRHQHHLLWRWTIKSFSRNDVQWFVSYWHESTARILKYWGMRLLEKKKKKNKKKKKDRF